MAFTISSLALITELLFGLFSYTGHTPQDAEMPYWLEGHWMHMDSPDTVRSGEVWRTGAEGSMYGIGYEIHHQDTVFMEKLRIETVGHSILYTVDVPHNPTPVHFMLVNSSYDKWVFENPEHDFPNSIAYIRNKPGYMTCIIAGRGRSRAFHFQKTE